MTDLLLKAKIGESALRREKGFTQRAYEHVGAGEMSTARGGAAAEMLLVKLGQRVGDGQLRRLTFCGSGALWRLRLRHDDLRFWFPRQDKTLGARRKKP